MLEILKEDMWYRVATAVLAFLKHRFVEDGEAVDLRLRRGEVVELLRPNLEGRGG